MFIFYERKNNIHINIFINFITNLGIGCRSVVDMRKLQLHKNCLKIALARCSVDTFGKKGGFPFLFRQTPTWANFLATEIHITM